MPSAVWPVGGVQLELLLAEVAAAGHRQRLRARPSDERRRGAPRSAPRRTRAARAGRRRARRAAAPRSTPRRRAAPRGTRSRPSRWSQSACVASRPTTRKPACSATAGSTSSSSGSTGESTTEASSPARTSVHVVCQNARRDDEDVRVEPDRPHDRAPTRRRAAWPPRGASSPRRSASSGWSSSCLLVAVDPDHRDLGLDARLDVVVVARTRRGPSPSCRRCGARTP